MQINIHIPADRSYDQKWDGIHRLRSHWTFVTVFKPIFQQFPTRNLCVIYCTHLVYIRSTSILLSSKFESHCPSQLKNFNIKKIKTFGLDFNNTGLLRNLQSSGYCAVPDSIPTAINDITENAAQQQQQHLKRPI